MLKAARKSTKNQRAHYFLYFGMYVNLYVGYIWISSTVSTAHTIEQAITKYIRLEQEKTVLRGLEKIVQQQYSCTIFSTGERVHTPGGGTRPAADSVGSSTNSRKMEKKLFSFQ